MSNISKDIWHDKRSEYYELEKQIEEKKKEALEAKAKYRFVVPEYIERNGYDYSLKDKKALINELLDKINKTWTKQEIINYVKNDLPASNDV